MRRSFPRKNIRRSNSRSISIFQRKFFQGLVFLICISLIIVFVFGDHGLLKLYRMKSERKLVQRKIANLRAERETLKNEKSKIENDLNYIEKIAREKYKMVKPGEKIFKVINN